MIRKIILLITSIIISLPLFADPQIILNTDIEGQLTMKRYYSSIVPENDISDGEYYIDEDGIHSSLSQVLSPFDLRAGFTTDDFIVTFFGSVASTQSQEVEVSNSSYYYLDGQTKIYISETPNIIDKSPTNGILTFYSGLYYESTTSTLPTYTFKIQSPTFNNIGAGRYFTDITISIIEN